MEVVFANPLYLWMLVSVPIVILFHFIAIRYSKARAIQFSNFVALSRISGNVGLTSNVSILLLRIVIFVLIIFAIAGTTIVYIGQNATIDYVLAVDASSSMLAEDFAPNRLESVKEASLEFVDSLPLGSSVGVISFSGTSLVESSLIEEKSQMNVVIEAIEPLAIGGTDIGNAIIGGSNLLLFSNKPRHIILLTDGRSNLGVPLETAVDYANEKGVIVHAIGIDSSDVELEGADILGIDEPSLRLVTELTGGRIEVVRTRGELFSAFESFSVIQEGKKFLDLSFFFILIALVLLLGEWVLVNTIFSRIP